MASTGRPDLLIGAKAAADYTAKQFYVVKLTASDDNSRTVTLCNGASDRPIGILQDSPNLGQACQVAIGDEAKGKAGGVFAVNALLGTDANGKLVEKTANKDWVLCLALEAGVDGRVVSVQLFDHPIQINV